VSTFRNGPAGSPSIGAVAHVGDRPPSPPGSPTDQPHGAFATIDCRQYAHQLKFDFVGVTRARSHHRNSTNEERNGEERSCDHGTGGRSRDADADPGNTSHGPSTEPATTRPLANGNEADECARRLVGRSQFQGLDSDDEPFDRFDVGLARRSCHRTPRNGGDARSGTAFEFAVGSSDASHAVRHRQPGFCVGNRRVRLAAHHALNGHCARPGQSVESTSFGQVGVESFECQSISHAVRIDADFGRCLDECLAGNARTTHYRVGVIIDAVFRCKPSRSAQDATRFVGVEWCVHVAHRNVDES
jgi:hypothetical protein